MHGHSLPMQLESKVESDFVDNTRRSVSLSTTTPLADESNLKSVMKGTSSPSAGESTQPKGVQLSLSAVDAPVRRLSAVCASQTPSPAGAVSLVHLHAHAQGVADTRAAGKASAVGEDVKPKERRSMGALPSTPPTEGEAMVVRRQPEELPRKDAQDRVFGERKRSTVTATQLRGVSMEDDREDVVSEPSVKGMAEPAEGLAAAKRAHEARIADFERDNEEWFSKQKACAVPAGHDGVRLKLPLADDDISKLIHSFTCPYDLPHEPSSMSRHIHIRS